MLQVSNHQNSTPPFDNFIIAEMQPQVHNNNSSLEFGSGYLTIRNIGVNVLRYVAQYGFAQPLSESGSWKTGNGKSKEMRKQPGV